MLDVAKAAVRLSAGPGSVLVDATAGRGRDTLFLARVAGPVGRVHAFDVQAEALRATARRLERAGCAGRVTLFHCGHERMAEKLEHERGRVAAVMFNLGFLPWSESALTTRADTTACALEAAWSLLGPGGMLSVACYAGHAGGAGEAAAVERWMRDRRARGAVVGGKSSLSRRGFAETLHLARR